MSFYSYAHRPPRPLPRGYCFASLVITMVAAVGCSSDPGVQEDEATVDLRAIARAYEAVMTPSGKPPPRSLDQIRSVLGDFHKDGIAGPPDEVLVSSRDNLPYVIILGADILQNTSGAILAYEQQGAEGTRYALLMSRDVRKLTDAEFAKAEFVQGHKPAAP